MLGYLFQDDTSAARQKTVAEAQQILEGGEYDQASKSYGGMHTMARLL